MQRVIACYERKSSPRVTLPLRPKRKVRKALASGMTSRFRAPALLMRCVGVHAMVTISIRLGDKVKAVAAARLALRVSAAASASLSTYRGAEAWTRGKNPEVLADYYLQPTREPVSFPR